MEINKLKSIIHEDCKFKIKDDVQNTYSHNLLPDNYVDSLKENDTDQWVDDHKFILNYDNGINIINGLSDSDSFFPDPLIIGTNNLKYKYSNASYNPMDQIAMIKLFMAVHLTRKVVKYNILENKAVQFTFKLFNKSTNHYDKDTLLTVDNRVLIDANNDVIVTDSDSLLDHLLLKAFIKLSNIMNINIKNCNVNSLVGICKGGKLFKLSVSRNVDANDLTYTVDSLLDDYSDCLDDKMKQCTWLHDNIFRSAFGESLHAYNEYALTIQKLFEQDNIIGMTLGDSFIYIVDDVLIEQNGGMTVIFTNIFGGRQIHAPIETVMNCLDKIGVIIKS